MRCYLVFPSSPRWRQPPRQTRRLLASRAPAAVLYDNLSSSTKSLLTIFSNNTGMPTGPTAAPQRKRLKTRNRRSSPAPLRQSSTSRPDCPRPHPHLPRLHRPGGCGDAMRQRPPVVVRLAHIHIHNPGSSMDHRFVHGRRVETWTGGPRFPRATRQRQRKKRTCNIRVPEREPFESTTLGDEIDGRHAWIDHLRPPQSRDAG